MFDTILSPVQIPYLSVGKQVTVVVLTMDMLISWGKSYPDRPYHPLLYHMLDVAAVCEVLAVTQYISEIPPAWIAYLAALHDIGKADPFFRNKDDRQAERLRSQGIILPA